MAWACYRTDGAGGGHNILLWNGYPLSLSGVPLCTPTRFAMPAARGKTSQCQRLVKRKEIIYLKVTQTQSNDLTSSLKY